VGIVITKETRDIAEFLMQETGGAIRIKGGAILSRKKGKLLKA
jgi:hypothetical protein